MSKKSKSKSQDPLGDRMKMYEGFESKRILMPRCPIVIRLDGKNFSKFTKGLKRPYDERLSEAMIFTTKKLVEEYNAVIGYTQSDEISLIIHYEGTHSKPPFGGRVQKMTGDMAICASFWFNSIIDETIPEKANLPPGKKPRFDCRPWTVPDKHEAANAILWRELDATKNSISMAAHHHFGHKPTLNKNGSEKQEMLFEKGINWNDYPDFFKRGTFIRRKVVETPFTKEEIDNLPPKHQARENSDLVITRSVIDVIPMPPFSKVINRVEVIFNGETPIVENNHIEKESKIEKLS